MRQRPVIGDFGFGFAFPIHRLRSGFACDRRSASLNGGSGSPRWSPSSPSTRGLVLGFLGFDVDPQFQVVADLLPADLEDRPPLAEMEALQRYGLDQLREIELGQLVEDLGFCPLMTI